MKFVRWLNIAAPACALAALTLPALGANEAVVDKCLAAAFYPEQQDLFTACEVAVQAKELAPAVLAKINLQLGQALYFSHQPGLALPYLDEAVRLDPALDQAFRRRGWANLMTGRGNKALADFTEFLALKPGDADALFALALARRQFGGDCAEAIAAYEQILKDRPDHYITRNSLAREYSCRDNNRQREVEEYEKIIAAGRDKVAPVTYYARRGKDDFDFYADVLHSRADAYRAVGRHDDSLADAAWLIAEYPANPKGYIARSNTKRTLRDGTGALADAERALELAPGHIEASNSKLWALDLLGRREEIISFASEVIDRGYRPYDISDFYYFRGKAHHQLGHSKEAGLNIGTAIGVDQNHLWYVTYRLQKSGYVFRSLNVPDGELALDPYSKEFANAFEACMIDVECLK